MPTAKPKKPRVDGQITGLAGEFYVAAELLKRDILASITFGSAKAIDILAYNPRTRRTISVQVKATRQMNVFPIAHSRVEAVHIYVFVVLNPPGTPPRFFVVQGQVLVNEPERFSKWFKDPKFPGFSVKYVLPFEDEWKHFEEHLGAVYHLAGADA
jgi:hypothetical protein